MSEDITRGLPSGSFEERVLSELSAIRHDLTGQREMIIQQGVRLTSVEVRLSSVDGRLTSLDERLSSVEEKVDARLRETRPIWEGVLARLTAIESELARMNRQFRSFVADIFQLRARVEHLEEENDKRTV